MCVGSEGQGVLCVRSLVRTELERCRGSWDNRIIEDRELVGIDGVVCVGGKDVISWARWRCKVAIVFVRIKGVIRAPFDDEEAAFWIKG